MRWRSLASCLGAMAMAIASPDQQACLEAMAKIRSLADVVLPAHDPLVLVRWPDGIIGAPSPTP